MEGPYRQCVRCGELVPFTQWSAGEEVCRGCHPLEVPDYIAPFVGWRTWQVRHFPDVGTFLLSLNLELWPHRIPLQAYDSSRWFPAPLAKLPVAGPGSPGIYCYKSLDARSITHFLELPCVGQVYIWGHVIEHAYGYRATRAYPKALLLGCDAEPQLVTALEKSYGVEVKAAPHPFIKPAEYLQSLRAKKLLKEMRVS